jgi:hypothetical protein
MVAIAIFFSMVFVLSLVFMVHPVCFVVLRRPDALGPFG